MRCPYCNDTHISSKLYLGTGGMTTLSAWYPYYDDEGKCHNHNPNAITKSYNCSNHHSFEVKTYEKCWCGWNKDKNDEYKFIRTNFIFLNNKLD